MEVSLGIRELAEFTLKSGSIESGFKGINRGLEGTRIHKALQKLAGGDYVAEQSLKADIQLNDVMYHLSGRADGIIYEDDVVVIDEIKTVTVPLRYIDEHTYPAHWGQAVFYAYIVANRERLDRMAIQLTYYNVDTEEIKYIRKEYLFEELKSRVNEILSLYERWAIYTEVHQEKRDQGLGELSFPFPLFRDGQRELSVAVYNTINESDRLFACAPTGIGKTMGCLFPSLKAMSEGKADKVFYLTAKTMTATRAMNAVRVIYDRDPSIELKTIMITAKDKACFLETRNCSAEACPYSNGYYDRINDVVFEAIQKYNCFDFELICSIAKEYNVCPYELSLDISQWCDIIICDYNYLFDPKVKLQRFFIDSDLRYIFLIDEAHNLPDRAREMYSRQLDSSTFRSVKKLFKGIEKKLVTSINKMIKAFDEIKDEAEETEGHILTSQALFGEIEGPIRRFIAQCNDYFDRHRGDEIEEELLELYFEASYFMEVYDGFDDRYVSIAVPHSKDLLIRLFCMDPSPEVDRTLCKGVASVLFSATLTPIDYYMNQLGEKGNYLNVRSPFPQENLCLVTTDYVNTRYSRRKASVDAIIDIIYRVIKARKGNYIVYFPSYAYMDMVYSDFIEEYPEIRRIKQESNMEEESKTGFLKCFEERDDVLAFCVLGGIFGEGIDLTGDLLTGTVIVSVGLPQINVYSDLIKDYYDSIGKDGYKYSYQYPGMNKVLQAVGRVIRTETDKGVAILVDDRFSTLNYLKNMPMHWNHLVRVSNADNLESVLVKFWK